MKLTIEEKAAFTEEIINLIFNETFVSENATIEEVSSLVKKLLESSDISLDAVHAFVCYEMAGDLSSLNDVEIYLQQCFDSYMGHYDCKADFIIVHKDLTDLLNYIDFDALWDDEYSCSYIAVDSYINNDILQDKWDNGVFIFEQWC